MIKWNRVQVKKKKNSTCCRKICLGTSLLLENFPGKNIKKVRLIISLVTGFGELTCQNGLPGIMKMGDQSLFLRDMKLLWGKQINDLRRREIGIAWADFIVYSVSQNSTWRRFSYVSREFTYNWPSDPSLSSKKDHKELPEPPAGKKMCAGGGAE